MILRAMMLKGFRIVMTEVADSRAELSQAVDGKPEFIELRDGGIMVCDREALPKEKPYNSIASLIAGTGVYGDAIIVGADGDGFCDVPDPFIALLNFPEDYFEQ